MPYITEEDRNRTCDICDRATVREVAEHMGIMLRTGAELNYFITEMIQSYTQDKSLRYTTISDVVGALEGSKQEFYRKAVNPYEAKKEFENGEIYTRLR